MTHKLYQLCKPAPCLVYKLKQGLFQTNFLLTVAIYLFIYFILFNSTYIASDLSACRQYLNIFFSFYISPRRQIYASPSSSISPHVSTLYKHYKRYYYLLFYYCTFDQATSGIFKYVHCNVVFS